MARRHYNVLAVIVLIVAVFSIKTTTPDAPEWLTISADAALSTDVEHGYAFIRPEGVASPVASRVSEDVSGPEMDASESDAAVYPPSPDRHPVSHRSAGVRRAILRVYRI